MFEWWADLPNWLKYGTAAAFLAASTLLYFSGYFRPWGWAVGLVLLMAAALVND